MHLRQSAQASPLNQEVRWVLCLSADWTEQELPVSKSHWGCSLNMFHLGKIHYWKQLVVVEKSVFEALASASAAVDRIEVVLSAMQTQN
jgi:hypothetical protein